MVFEPTFHEIDEQATQLPDLGGDGAAPEEPIVAPSASEDDEATADVEGTAAVATADIEADDLPPYGVD
ncbi:MAG: hypothetical protein J0J00_06780 [Microbacterium sp.]|nr:hypothetical protein [Microbacterium sp.]MBN9180242.1 hypothetical protein [Microbacterium sp.]